MAKHKVLLSLINMNFNFEHKHFAMASREAIKATKDLARLSPVLLEIVVSELQNGNIILRVQKFGDNEMEVLLKHPYSESYSPTDVEHVIETDPHYRGDFYRVGRHAVVAPINPLAEANGNS